MRTAKRPHTAEPNSDLGDETRSRLLEAAGEVFAKRGFDAATVREICTKAGANVAAVNYHFRGKDELYREVFAYFAKAAVEKYPPTLNAGPGAPAEERLRSFIAALMFRALDDGQPEWGGTLMMREFVNPTHVLSEFAEYHVKPMMHILSGIVRELLTESGHGRSPDALLVRRCAHSVLGQCLFYKHARPVIERVVPDQRFDRAELETLAAHISAFSLAAIRAIPAARARRKS